MNIKRITKHLLLTHWQVKRVFPGDTLLAFDRAIKESESAHDGEVRFAVEGALDGAALLRGQSAKERAIEVFSQLRIWDTEHNNGVLIYLLLADRHVEIVADRGIHAKVGTREWAIICRMMESSFEAANYEGGVISGIQAVTRHLMKHFPRSDDDRNELSDEPVVL
jgi:hypothetical protein